VLFVFEEYIEKEVKVYAQIGDRPFSFEGKILSVNETHIKMLDKFQKEQLILIQSIQQLTIKEARE